MNIGVNLLYLRPGLVGGSEVYIRELISNMSKDESNQYILFGTAEVENSFAKLPHVSFVSVGKKFSGQLCRQFNENIWLSFLLRRYNVDILFSPANFAIPFLFSRVPQVCTVHDLQHLWLPHHFSFLRSFFRSVLFRISFARCFRIIAISNFTRQDIINRYKVSPDRVIMIHNGCNDVNTKTFPSISQDICRKYNLTSNFFYYPAAMFRHKNHITIIEAFAQFLKETNERAALVFTGAQNDVYNQVMDRVKLMGLEKSVVHLGFVPREDVFSLTAMAVAVLFPSEFEGFGLPVLEAMNCGVPVIASNTASIPEIAGDAAILLDPHNVKDWAGMMVSVYNNNELRRQLINKGFENANRFSWEKCAFQTLTLLLESGKR